MNRLQKGVWALAGLFFILQFPFRALAQSVQSVSPKIIFSQSPQSLFADSLQPPAQVQFFVKTIEVEGSTVLSSREIRKIVAPYEGKELTLETLKHVAQLITQAYLKKGYILAKAIVPPQTIENGVIRISVTEGRVGTIKVEGNRGYTVDFIKRFLSPGLEHGVLQSDKFERSLLILNEFPDLRVESYFQKGKQAGTTDIVIRAKDQTPLHESLSFNNFGDIFTGRSRASVDVSDGNLTGSGDTLDGQMTFPFPSKGHPFIVGSFSRPFGVSGNRFSLSYSNSDIRIASGLEALGIVGSAVTYAFAMSHPLVRTSTETSNIIESLSIKTARNFIFESILTNRDKIRELSFEYNHRWATHQGTTFVDATVSKGLGTWFGGMAKNDPIPSRAGADDDFLKATISASRIQRAFGNVMLFIHGSAQWSANPLATLEQYSAGGADSVRGYKESEVLGDEGWSVSNELRFPLNDVNSPNALHLAVFMDVGYTAIRNPQPSDTPKHHLTGAGIGVRYITGPTFLRADIGYPLDPTANTTHEIPSLYLQASTQF